MADTPMVRDAVADVIRALRDPGSHPTHHETVRARHSMEWPTLHGALTRLAMAYDHSETDPPPHLPTVLEEEHPELWELTYRAVWESCTLPHDQVARVAANIILKMTSSPAALDAWEAERGRLIGRAAADFFRSHGADNG